MRITHKPNWRLVALYPALFVLIVSGAFIFGATKLRIGAKPPTGEPPPKAVLQAAPTVSDYRASVQETMAPFYALVDSYSAGSIVEPDAESALLVQEVRDGMLGLRLPSSEREAHLAMVLMLDQWQRALTGSYLDGRRALASAEQVARDYPWSVARQSFD